jgi:hypothetical protein
MVRSYSLHQSSEMKKLPRCSLWVYMSRSIWLLVACGKACNTGKLV